jgi:hypothetical protein
MAKLSTLVCAPATLDPTARSKRHVSAIILGTAAVLISYNMRMSHPQNDNAPQPPPKPPAPIMLPLPANENEPALGGAAYRTTTSLRRQCRGRN